MAMTDTTIILRSLKARPVSTATTALIVAVAVGLLLVLLTLRDATDRAFQRGVGNVHLLVSGDASPLEAVLNGLFYANAPRRPLTWQTYRRIADERPWDFAIPTSLGDSFLGRPVLATTPAFFDVYQPQPGMAWSFAEGRPFRAVLDLSLPPEQRDAAFEVVLGAEVAEASGLRLGDDINLTHGSPRDPAAHVHLEYAFRVVGILEPTGTLHDRALFAPLESSWVMHAHDRRPEPGVLTGPRHLTDADTLITGILLGAPMRRAGTPVAAFQSWFDDLRRDPTITVASPGQQIERLRGIIGNVDWLLLSIAGVVLVSGATSIGLAMAGAMGQRRRQIAVLRVLGASRARVVGLVVTESAAMGAIGAVVGVVFGLLALRVAGAYIFHTHGLVIAASPSPEWILLVAVGAIALAALAGLAPAAIAYRLPVIRNLRPLA